jgi:integrase
MTLRELLAGYEVLHGLKGRTVQLIGDTINRLQDFLGREPTLDDLDDMVVARFARWRATTPHRGRMVAPATVRKDLAHLTSIWNHAARKRMKRSGGDLLEFPSLPRGLVKVPHKAPKGYTIEDIAGMLEAAQNRFQPVGPVPGSVFWTSLILAAWETGARIGSLLGVRWEDLTGQQIYFRPEEYKGGVKSITRPISAELSAQLEPHRRDPGELVWPWCDYRKKNSIFQALRMICHEADVTPRGFHAIRKAAGSYVAAAGGESAAQQFLAHENARTTRAHYLDPSIVKERSGLEFLPKLPTKPR